MACVMTQRVKWEVMTEKQKQNLCKLTVLHVASSSTVKIMLHSQDICSQVVVWRINTCVERGHSHNSMFEGHNLKFYPFFSYYLTSYSIHILKERRKIGRDQNNATLNFTRVFLSVGNVGIFFVGVVVWGGGGYWFQRMKNNIINLWKDTVNWVSSYTN